MRKTRSLPVEANFLDAVVHVLGRDELAFLHVDGAAGFAGGDEQVGLTAEEGGNLEDVAGLGDGCAVRGLVDIGEDGKVRLFGDAAQDARAFSRPGPRKLVTVVRLALS